MTSALVNRALALVLVLVCPAAGLVACGGDTSADATDRPDSDDVSASRRLGAGVAGRATVTRVIDGDTIVVDVGGDDDVHVRLIGIDTPEPSGGFQPEECFGDEASAFTTDLLPAGTVVRLERDVEARDRYDRLLAYVYLVEDDLFVNGAIVAAGMAGTLSIAPNTAHEAELSAAAAEARAEDLGLWGACGGPDQVIG